MLFMKEKQSAVRAHSTILSLETGLYFEKSMQVTIKWSNKKNQCKRFGNLITEQPSVL